MQKEDDDGDGNSSFTCLKKCINVGSSGIFETYDKSDTDAVGGWGVPVSIFYFGETQKCRVEVTQGGVVPPSQAAANPGANTVAGTSASSTASTGPDEDNVSTETSSNGSPSSSQGPGVQFPPDSDKDALGETSTEAADPVTMPDTNVENSADGIPLIAACILPLLLLTKNLVP